MELRDAYLLKLTGYGNGNGYGDGYGYGNGNGYGYGYGYGNGYGNGNGYGYGYGNGDGDGDGDAPYFAKLWGEWFEVSGELENSLCINIPEHHYDKITREFIGKVTNLENLRILREKIGLQKYLSLFDAKVIHNEMDNQGNQMNLYKYDEKGESVILLEVICPSTDRMYHLYPPDQKAKTCSQAKKSTFGNKSLAYRHGDVGFFKVGDNKITVPFSET